MMGFDPSMLAMMAAQQGQQPMDPQEMMRQQMARQLMGGAMQQKKRNTPMSGLGQMGQAFMAAQMMQPRGPAMPPTAMGNSMTTGMLG
jgi:hypothetical protein